MRTWKNAFVTLSLPPTATREEIRSRERNMADASEEAARRARNARECLTQNVNDILSSFLGAIPGLSSMEADLKTLRKRNRGRKELNDEILAEAFGQMGLSFVQQEVSAEDIDRSVVPEIERHIGIKNHFEDLQKFGGSQSSSGAYFVAQPEYGAPLPPPPPIIEG